MVDETLTQRARAELARTDRTPFENLNAARVVMGLDPLPVPVPPAQRRMRGFAVILLGLLLALLSSLPFVAWWTR